MARNSDSILDQIRELVGIDTTRGRKKAKKSLRAKKSKSKKATKKSRRTTTTKSKRR